jgi:5-methylthioadenosine/S-adenosylhomocysteine deaminase
VVHPRHGADGHLRSGLQFAKAVTPAVIRYHARWVLPVSSAPLRDATVCVDGDTIAWVGSRPDAPPGEDVDLGEAILTPGLVNAHVHLDLSAFAGVIPRSSFFTWVRSLVAGVSDASDEHALRDVSRWTIAEQLAHGVTTVAHTGPGTHAFEALLELGTRGIAFVEVFGPDPHASDAAMGVLQTLVDAARQRESALVHIGVSPHAPYSVSDILYRKVAEYAGLEELPVAVHIAESADEMRLVHDGTGDFSEFLRGRGIEVNPRAASPIALLESTGVLRSRPLCVHAIHANDADVQLLADAGASVAHCPRANAWLRHDTAPVRAFVASGIAVGLGTDSAASNDGLRMLAEARVAAGDLSPAERIELATLGGARALQLGNVGALRSGYQADIAAFPIGDGAACDADPARYLLDYCVDVPAALTMVAGQVRARGGVVDGVGGDLLTRMQQHRARACLWRDGVAFADRTNLDFQS